uniref:BTB domain-containing protein n=1 Tax=Steinernema glaseri TaxID=37863 RepID=A0A1I8ARM2_9BILA
MDVLLSGTEGGGGGYFKESYEDWSLDRATGSRMTSTTGTIKGTIEMTPGARRRDATCEVDIGGAKWALIYYIYDRSTVFVISCTVEDRNKVLWNCEARGQLTVRSSDEQKSTLWTGSFTCLQRRDGYAASDSLEFFISAREITFEAKIEVTKMTKIHLSSPTNQLIDCLDDAACLRVEGEKLWVSKKVLSMHSPFFKAMFTSNFMEKATGAYVLRDVRAATLKAFLCVVYNLDVPMNAARFEGLLRLGDMYQCDTVLRFCRELLRNPKTEYVSLKTKIMFCDRHDYTHLLASIIREAPLDDLKEFVKNGNNGHLNPFAHQLIEERLVRSDVTIIYLD